MQTFAGSARPVITTPTAAAAHSPVGFMCCQSLRDVRPFLPFVRSEGRRLERSGQAELPAWKEEHNRSHRKVRACVEHALARMR